MKPRHAALVGLIFVAFAAFYVVFALAVDPAVFEPAAVVELIALGAATALMAYVLVAGTRNGGV